MSAMQTMDRLCQKEQCQTHMVRRVKARTDSAERRDIRGALVITRTALQLTAATAGAISRSGGN